MSTSHKNRRARGVQGATENGMGQTETKKDHDDGDGVYQKTKERNLSGMRKINTT